MKDVLRPTCQATRALLEFFGLLALVIWFAGPLRPFGLVASIFTLALLWFLVFRLFIAWRMQFPVRTESPKSAATTFGTSNPKRPIPVAAPTGKQRFVYFNLDGDPVYKREVDIEA